MVDKENRLGMIMKSYPDDENQCLVGGASKSPYRLAKSLAQIVVVKRIIAMEGKGRKGGEPIVTIIKSPFTRLYFKTLVQNILMVRSLFILFKESDVIQCHHPHYGLTAAILRTLFFKKKILLVKAHGTARPELRANQYKGIRATVLFCNSLIHLVHDRYVLSCADLVLCSSQFQFKEMSEIYKIPAGKLKVFYNGYDSRYFYSDQTHKAVPAEIRMVMCARVVPKKGILYAIQLFLNLANKAKGLKLLLVLGKACEIEDINTWNEIQEVSSGKNIQLFFDLTESELGNLFRSSQIGLVTSHEYESIPSVIYEMGACGLPVFATWDWGIKEIVEFKFGLTLDIEKDANKIQQFMNDELVSGVSYQQYDEYSYDKLARKYVDLYEGYPC